MREVIMLMHNDAASKGTSEMRSLYFSFLRGRKVFEGGSSIGAGEASRKHAIPGQESKHLAGYIRVTAESMTEARALLAGNPVSERGGTVEIRELPRERVGSEGLVSNYLSATVSSMSKNSGNEIAADSAPRMAVSPCARKAAIEKAMAMR